MSRVSPPLLFLGGVAMLWSGARGAALWWDGTSAPTALASRAEAAAPAALRIALPRQVQARTVSAPGHRRASQADGFGLLVRLPRIANHDRAARTARAEPWIAVARARPVPWPAPTAPFLRPAEPRIAAAPSPPLSSDPALRSAASGAARPRDRWRLSAWAFARPQGASPALGQGLLGGSQLGLRAGHRIGRVEAYARIVSSGRIGDGAEGAVGVAAQPVRGLPVSLVVERRESLVGSGGRSAWAAMAVGGVSDAPMPLRFRLDGYGAAGVVGAERRDLFAEGSATLRRSLVNLAGVDVSAGAGLWAATQPGLLRVDVGPSVSARLALGGLRPRLSIDWRHRVAGDAGPRSGPAIALAADF